MESVVSEDPDQMNIEDGGSVLASQSNKQMEPVHTSHVNGGVDSAENNLASPKCLSGEHSQSSVGQTPHPVNLVCSKENGPSKSDEDAHNESIETEYQDREIDIATESMKKQISESTTQSCTNDPNSIELAIENTNERDSSNHRNVIGEIKKFDDNSSSEQNASNSENPLQENPKLSIKREIIEAEMNQNSESAVGIVNELNDQNSDPPNDMTSKYLAESVLLNGVPSGQKSPKILPEGQSKKFKKLNRVAEPPSNDDLPADGLRRSSRRTKPISYANLDNEEIEPDLCDGVVKVLLYIDPHDTESSLKLKVDGGHIKGYMFASDTIESAKQQCTSWSSKSKIKIPCYNKIPRPQILAKPIKQLPKLNLSSLPAYKKAAMKAKKKYTNKKKPDVNSTEKWKVCVKEDDEVINNSDNHDTKEIHTDEAVGNEVSSLKEKYGEADASQHEDVENMDEEALEEELLEEDIEEIVNDEEDEYVPDELSDNDEDFVPSRKAARITPKRSSADKKLSPKKFSTVRKRGRPKKGEILPPRPPKIPKIRKSSVEGKGRGRPRLDGSSPKPKPKGPHSGKHKWLIPSKTLPNVSYVKHNDETSYYVCGLCCYTSCSETQIADHVCNTNFTDEFKELKDPYNIDFEKHIRLDGMKTSICKFCEFGALNRYVVEQHILRHHVALPSLKDMLSSHQGNAENPRDFPHEGDEEESIPVIDPENSNDADEAKSKYKLSVIMSRYNGVLSRAVGKIDVELCKKLRIKQPDDDKTYCFWCSEALNDNEEPEEHFKSFHYRHICDPYYTYAWNKCLDRGMVEYKADKIYNTCLMCEGPCLTNSLVEHMYVRHGLQKGFPCPICQTDLPSLIVRQKHLFEKHGEATLDRLETKSLRYCAKCNITFAKKIKYEQHMLTYHSSTSKFICPVDNCGFRFILQHDLVIHLHKVHLENIVKTKTDPVMKICEYCGKEVSQSYLKQHIKSNHETEKTEDDDGVPTTSEDDIPIACKICQKMTSGKAAYKRHMRNFHTGPHKCPFDDCSMVYEAQNNLKAHIKYFHMNRKPSICDICGMKFRSRNQLDTHYTTVHLGQKNFKCEWPGCNKTFGRIYSMRIHYKIHTGEKPRQCQYCDYSTLQKASLNWHMKSRHPEIPFSSGNNDGRHVPKKNPDHKPIRRRAPKKIAAPEIPPPEIEYRQDSGSGEIKEESVVGRPTLASLWAANHEMVASWNNIPSGEQPADYTFRTIQNAAQHLQQQGTSLTLPHTHAPPSHQHPSHHQPSQTEEGSLNELAQVAVSASSFTPQQQHQYFQQWQGNKERPVKVSNLTEAMQASGLWPPSAMGFMFPPDQ